ncbi:MAG: 30S ribosomal protein S1 [Anaerolineae bacterium]
MTVDQEVVQGVSEEVVKAPSEANEGTNPAEEAQSPQKTESPRWWKLFVEGDYDTERPRRGDIYEATILSLGEHDILVDVDGKRDGIILERDLENVDETYLEELKVGQKIPVRIVKIPYNRNAIVVSLKQGLEHQDWIRAERLMESRETIEVEVVGVNRGGVLAPFGRLQGFIPNSHLTSIPRGTRSDKRRELKQELVGETLTVMVIEVNQRRRRLILSERVARARRAQEILEELHEGAIRTGIVSNLVDFGAFIDLGGVDGLLHISEISWDHIDHPRDVLDVGDEVEVYILDVDRERERIALSRKRLLPDPWEKVTAGLHRGDVVEGTITHITDFGAFVDVGEGVEGLVHVSEMPNGEQTLAELTPSTSAQVQILYIDPLQQRISLRLEETEEPSEPEETEEAVELAEAEETEATEQATDSQETAESEEAETADQ